MRKEKQCVYGVYFFNKKGSLELKRRISLAPEGLYAFLHCSGYQYYLTFEKINGEWYFRRQFSKFKIRGDSYYL